MKSIGSWRTVPHAALLALLCPQAVPAGTTILHYRVNASDAAAVAGGSIPGTDGSPDGVAVFGTVALSAEIPTEGVPAGAGNQSLGFAGNAGINLPGTQQLLNSLIEANGGFTYETWFRYDGGGTVNSIIDYAGTEKLVRESAGTDAGYRNNSAAPLYLLGAAAVGEWHYAAVVFTATSPVAGDGSITGDFTFYFDGNVATGSQPGVTISNFGDSLNRTICVGAHPLGFGADFFPGLIYEPRVSLGALGPAELLYGAGSDGLRIIDFAYDPGPESPGARLVWTSRPNTIYAVDFSDDLSEWMEITDNAPSGGATTEWTHLFLPEFPDLVGESQLFYRVRQLPE